MGEPLSERQALLILNALPNIGPVTLNRLLAELSPDPREILLADEARLRVVRGVGPVIAQTLRTWPEHFDLAQEERRLAEASADFLTGKDADYPAALREIHDPPIGLYRKGRYDFGRPAIAIVGSRRTTLYGQAVAAKLGAELAAAGFCIVSGLARGIDTAAHAGALKVGGRTAAVLGTGIDLIYPPENLALYRQIAAEGAIITEFPFGRRADRQSFAMRNRIVAGLCAAVIVVESDLSGGSMITARFAGEQGRQLFAVPGRIDQPTSAGCHQLIRDGATLLTGVDDVLNELSYLRGLTPIAPTTDGATSAEPLAPLSGDEARLLACFAGGNILSLDALATLTGLSIATVAPALMLLELKRRVAKRADGTFEVRPTGD